MKGRFGYISETLLLFLIIDGLGALLFPNDLGFLKAPVSPYWIPILVVATRWGVAGGLVSSGVAVAHYLFFAFGELPSRLDLEIEAEVRGLDLPLLFLLVGAFLGAVRQRYIRAERKLEAELDCERGHVELERQKYQASEEVRQAIEAKIVGQTVTVRTLYHIAMQFSEGSEQEIFRGCMELLSEHFGVSRASIWLREGGDFVVSETLGWGKGEAVEGRRSCDRTALDLAYRRNRMTTPQQIGEWAGNDADDATDFVALFAIQGEDGAAVGVVAIEHMEFLSLTRSNLDLIELIVEWMSRSLSTTRKIAQLQRDVMWDSKFNVYSPHYFREALDREFVRARDLGQGLSIAMLQVENYGGLSPETRDLIAQSVVVALKRRLDESSLLCSYDLDGVFAVLSPSMEEQALDVRLAEVQKELSEMNVVRTLKLDEKVAEYNPYLSFGCVTRSEEMESCSDLERAALKACGLGGVRHLFVQN